MTEKQANLSIKTARTTLTANTISSFAKCVRWTCSTNGKLIFSLVFFSLSLISLLLLWWITIRHHFYSAEVNMLWHMVDIDTTILIAHRIEYSHHHLIDTDELINWTPAQKINARTKKKRLIYIILVSKHVLVIQSDWLINCIWCQQLQLSTFLVENSLLFFLYASIDYEILRDSFYFSDFTERYHPTLFSRHRFPWLVSCNNEFCLVCAVFIHYFLFIFIILFKFAIIILYLLQFVHTFPRCIN